MYIFDFGVNCAFYKNSSSLEIYILEKVCPLEWMGDLNRLNKIILTLSKKQYNVCLCVARRH